MSNRHLLPLAAMAALSLAACSKGSAEKADAKVVASGQTGQRSFALTNFDRVTLRGPDSVEVRAGPAFSVVAQGDTGVLKAIEIVTEGTELKIGRVGQERSGFRWGGGNDGDDDSASVKVIVTMPAIRAAAIAGSGDMRVDRITGDAFEGVIAGSGDLSLGSIAAKSVELSIAGAGDVRASGTADSVKIAIAGAGDIDAGGLATKDADVSIAGAGNARLMVDGPATVSIVGSGDVDLGPKARCTTSMAGAGEVICGSGGR